MDLFYLQKYVEKKSYMVIKDHNNTCDGTEHCLHKDRETMAEEYWSCCLGDCDYTERRNK